jgi:hypothetical protein
VVHGVMVWWCGGVVRWWCWCGGVAVGGCGVHVGGGVELR